MPVDARRALLTEREREIVSGEADVTDKYRDQTVSRVRRRITEELAVDIDALAAHGDLLEDFHETVRERIEGRAG